MGQAGGSTNVFAAQPVPGHNAPGKPSVAAVAIFDGAPAVVPSVAAVAIFDGAPAVVSTRPATTPVGRCATGRAS
ncbi:hypothetical protein, partial [Mycolicibacter algericus]|uniref:hypothetical protein n=1 Tax=Mycolicibacter algericus TaxID=1288388 RepID=UPI0021F3A494